MKNTPLPVFALLTAIAGLVTSNALTSAQTLSPDARLGGTNAIGPAPYGGFPGWSNPSWSGSNWLGWNNTSAMQDWRLGVQVDNLETGVYVKQVAPGSSAARVNIEVGDVIVAVGGQQVGYVDRQPVDIGAAIKAKADATGNVTLLVQDSRTGRLASIRVKLDGAQSSLRGQVVIRDRYGLPPDAQVTVAIENVSRPYYTVRNGEVTTFANGQYSIPFEIPYDQNYITASDIYQVRARIASSGRILFETQQPVRVLTGGAPASDVQILVVPVGQSTVGIGGSSPVITAGYPGVDTMLNQYRQYYRRYLGRDPTQLEMAAFMASPPPTSPNDIPIQLMASQQFFDLLGNNNALWLTNVFQQVIGRTPQPEELAQWTRRLAELGGSRTELLRQLYLQKPYGT